MSHKCPKCGAEFPSDEKCRDRFEWRVTAGEKLEEFGTIVCSRTIADVRLDNPRVYRADVELWATSVLADTQPLVQSYS
jgi:hypothetical protein